MAWLVSLRKTIAFREWATVFTVIDNFLAHSRNAVDHLFLQ